MTCICNAFLIICILINILVSYNGEELEDGDHGNAWNTFSKSPNVKKKVKSQTGRSSKSNSVKDHPVTPVVEMDAERKVQGRRFKSRKDRNYYSFKGIPFGKITERFMEAVEAPPWEGILEAHELPPYCIQWQSFSQNVEGEEDCLKLTVYTSSLSKTANRPVMVWTSPGGFQMGGARLFKGAYMMDEDVVLVSINSRLGALGFLNTKGVVSGNMGLKDQVLALRWVKKYIRVFGGDPHKVTIAGLSCGGASAHYHLLSTMSKGLIQRAISQSGVALNPWAFQPDPVALAIQLGNYAGCPTAKFDEMVACLQKLPAKKVIEAERKIAIHPRELDFISMRFVPSVERNDGKGEKFITDTPWNIMSKKMTSSNIPVIMGFTANEGGFYTAELFIKPASIKMLNSNNKKLTVTPNIMYYEHVMKPTELQAASRKIYDFYFGDYVKDISEETHRNLSDAYSDRLFLNGIAKSIDMLSKYHSVYPYIFTYLPERSGIEFDFNAKYDDSVHADDMNFIFNNIGDYPFLTWDSKDGNFSVAYIKMLVDFMRDGHPPSWYGEWPKQSPSTPIRYKMVDEERKMILDPYIEKRAMWDSLQFKEHENQFKSKASSKKDKKGKKKSQKGRKFQYGRKYYY